MTGVTVRFRHGFLDELQAAHGLQTEAALAGAIGVSPSVLCEAKQNGVASLQLIVGISRAFGNELSEIAYVEPVSAGRSVSL